MSNDVHRELNRGRTGTRVLVIEDDPRYQAVLAETLVMHGYELLLSHNGDDGLRLARQERPDLVLLDLARSGASGPALLGALHRDARTGSIPVVVASGATDALLAHERPWAAAILRKPFDTASLLACLERLLRARQATPHSNHQGSPDRGRGRRTAPRGAMV